MAEASNTAPVKTATQTNTGRTVTVACKHPAGIKMRLFKMVEDTELVLGGGTRKVKRAELMGDPVTVYGTEWPMSVRPPCTIIGGYALTEHVDGDFFDEWLKQNAQSDLVKNEIIFAFESADGAEGSAREHAAVKTGLEPLNPEAGDPRIPRGITGKKDEDAKAA